MSIPVFWMEPSGRVQVRLRTFHSHDGNECVARKYCCDAEVIILAEAPEEEWREEYSDPSYLDRTFHRARAELVAKDDPRWPTHCDACGIEFPDDASRQVWADRLYRGAPDGKLYNERSLPVGSLRHCEWLAEMPQFTGPDGIALECVTPGGAWMIDSQASNCTRPGDLSHKCWVRHGDPRDPQGLTSGIKLHVDKAGETCAAGAGSILAGKYHGFLHHGALT